MVIWNYTLTKLVIDLNALSHWLEHIAISFIYRKQFTHITHTQNILDNIYMQPWCHMHQYISEKSFKLSKNRSESLNCYESILFVYISLSLWLRHTPRHFEIVTSPIRKISRMVHLFSHVEILPLSNALAVKVDIKLFEFNFFNW